MKIVCLGAGMIGRTIVADLASTTDATVICADRSEENLELLRSRVDVETRVCDFSDEKQLDSIIAAADFVVDALPGFLGFSAYKKTIEQEKPIVDIAFFPEDPFALDALAKKKGVPAVMDCGVAPGLSNILVGRAASELDSVDDVMIYVGGLPVERIKPFEYKAVFSPVDVMEEFTRPAKCVENGKTIIKEPMCETELRTFPHAGKLEAFLTDGSRTLVETIKAKNIKEKTLRYPGHRDHMAFLSEVGFLSEDPIEINGVKISPVELSKKLILPLWKYNVGDADFTVMQVRVEGTKDGKATCKTYDLYDEYDPTTQTSSMARTTGFTATAAVNLLLKGIYQQPGVVAPELLGQDAKCYEAIVAHLQERGVTIGANSH